MGWTDVAVTFLSRPEAYPERPREVATIETHLSWVFLTDARAYKLKKAGVHDSLDLRPLEARRRNGGEEVRLNRRLAPDVYLGVTPLTRDAAGRLSIDGAGEVVDWLVVMRRLPAGAMLDRQVREGRVDETEVRAFARLMADFYATRAERAQRTGTEHRRFLHLGALGDRRELARPEFGLDRSSVARATGAVLGLLERLGRSIERRAAEGRLVDGHGDLRPEHVVLGPEPLVIDCLEFDRELRVVDPADELAFLALECHRLRAPEVGAWVIDEYERRTGDRLPLELTRFYRAYRACRRAVLAVWHLHDPRADVAKWRGRAGEYLALALEAALQPSRSTSEPPS